LAEGRRGEVPLASPFNWIFALKRTFMRKNRAHNMEFLDFIHRIWARNGILCPPLNEKVFMRNVGIGVIVFGFIDVACHWFFDFNIYEQINLSIPDWLYSYSPAVAFLLGTAIVSTADKNKNLDQK
jgi:hypothetical protein